VNPAVEKALHDQVLETMSHAAAADEWDVEPVMLLWFADAAGELGYTDMPGFAYMLEQLRGNLREVPGVAAQFVRKAAADGVAILDPDSTQGLTLVAVMLCHEGWGFMRPKDEAQAAEMAEWARTKSIADHPLGNETRNITAVGPDGFYLSAVHLRGEAEPVLMSSMDGSRAQATGYVMDGLRDLHAAITETM
jgi:hypothetical protein